MGTCEVNAPGEMAQTRLFLKKPRVGGIMSELFQSCGLRLGAPAGTQECPLLANNVVSVTRWHGSFSTFLSTQFFLFNCFYNGVDTKQTPLPNTMTDSGYAKLTPCALTKTLREMLYRRVSALE